MAEEANTLTLADVKLMARGAAKMQVAITELAIAWLDMSKSLVSEDELKRAKRKVKRQVAYLKGLISGN